MAESNVTMPRAALEAMLEDAAERGAKKALASIGLHDDKAGEDVRGLRDLFGVYRTIRNGALKQLGALLMMAILTGLALFAYTKMGGKL